MKRKICGMAGWLGAALLILGAVCRADTLLLSDNFNSGSYGASAFNSTLASDQAGTQATVSYTVTGYSEDYKIQHGNGGELLMAGWHASTSLNLYASLNHNFAAEANAVNKPLKVQFNLRIIDSSDASNWATLAIGSSQNVFVNDAANKFSSLFRHNGGTQQFASGGDISSGATWTASGSTIAVILSDTAGTGSPFNGNGSVARMYVNGALVGTYTLAQMAGTDGYLTFEGNSVFTYYDNLSVSLLCPIVWNTPAAISADTDVATTGTLVYAYTESGSGATVNGVPFAAGNSTTSLGGGNVTMSGFDGGVDTSTYIGANPVGLSSAYQTVVKGGAFSSGIGATVNLNNLVSGHRYLVQYWVCDYRQWPPNVYARSETLTSVTTSGALTYLQTDGSGVNVGAGSGTYVTGTFTADSTSQTITVTPNASAQMNAIQVREIMSFDGYAASNTTTYVIGATDWADYLGGDASFSTANSGGRLYWRSGAGAGDGQYMHFDLSSLSGKTVVAPAYVTLQNGNATWGGEVDGSVVATANGGWTAGGGQSVPGATSVASAANASGSYGSGSSVSWGVGSTPLQGLIDTPASYNGLAVIGGSGSHLHFNGPMSPYLTVKTGTLSGGSQSGVITVSGGGAWNAANYSFVAGDSYSAAASLRISGNLVASGTAGNITINGANVLVNQPGGAYNYYWAVDSTRINAGGTLTANGHTHIHNLTLAGGELGGTSVDGTFGGWSFDDATTVTGGVTSTISARQVNLDNGNITVSSGSTLSFSGSIRSGSITKYGTGTMTLSGANGYGGVTDVQVGTLVAANSTALGSGGWNGATMTFIRDGATLALQGGVSLDEHMHLTGAGVGSLGALRSISGNNALTLTWNGGGSGPGFGLDGNTTVGVDADTFTVSGFYHDSGSYGITKVGGGTLVLTEVQTYTGGTTVNEGTLQVAGNGGYGRLIGTLTVGASGTVLVSGDGTGLGYYDQLSTVNVNGGLVTSAGTMHIWNITGGMNLAGGTLQSNGGVNNAGGSQLEWNRTSVNATGDNTSTIAGRINIRGDNGYTGISFNISDGASVTDLLVSAPITEASGGLGITKSGAGTMALSGVNSYSGATTIDAGTIRAASGARNLGSGAVNVGGSGRLDIAALSANTGLALLESNWGGDIGQISRLAYARRVLAVTTPGYSTATAVDITEGGSGWDNHVRLYTGMIKINTGGTYTFNTTSDDGSMVWVDGQEVVYNDYWQGMTQRSGSIALSAGYHSLQVAYIQGSGGYGLHSQYSGPDTGDVLVDLNTGNAQLTPDLAIGSLTGSGSVELSTGNLIAGSDGSSTAFSGAITADAGLPGGLLKVGAGTLTLSGANTYTGTTTVAQGNLRLANAGGAAVQGDVVLANAGSYLIMDADNQFGPGAGLTFSAYDGHTEFALYGHNQTIASLSSVNALAVVQNSHSGLGAASASSTLTVNQAVSTVYSGVMRDNTGNDAYTLALVKTGSGTLTLQSMDPTHTGGTTVIGGMLQLSSSSPYGAITIGGTGTVRAASWNALNNVSSLTVNSGGLYVAASGVASGTGGNIYMNGGTFATEGSGDGTYGSVRLDHDVIIGGSSRSTISGDMRVGYNNTRTFDVGATGDPSGIDLLYSGKLGHLNSNSWGYMNKSGAGTMAMTGAGNEIGQYTVSAGKLLFVDNMTGGLNGGIVDNAAVEAQIGAGLSATYGYGISGSGTLTKTGAGTLTLTGGNTYSGTTTVDGGMLRLPDADWDTGNPWGAGGATGAIIVNSNCVLSTYAGVTELKNGLTLNGGTVVSRGIAYGGAGNWGNLLLSSDVTAGGSAASTIGSEVRLNGTRTFTVNADSTLSITGTVGVSPFNASGALYKNGSGTLILTAISTYAGGTTVNQGTLELNGATGGNGLIRGAVAVNAGAALVITGGDGTGFGWSPGVSSLTVNGGTVNAASGSHVGFGSYATVALNNGGTISGSWQWNGDSMLGFSSSGDSANIISGSVTLRSDNGANHTFNVADGAAAIDLQVDAVLSDQYPEVWWTPASGLTKTGAGTMKVSAANTYDGDTTINAGVLQLGHANAVQNSTVWVNVNSGLAFGAGVGLFNAGALAGAGNVALVDTGLNPVTLSAGGNGVSSTYSGQLSGSGGLTKTGGGTLELTGNSSFSGGTTVSAGTLKLGNSGNTQGIVSDVVVNSGGTLVFTTYNQLGAAVTGNAPTNTVTMNSGSVMSWTNTVETFNTLVLNGVNLALNGGFDTGWGALGLGALTASGSASITAASGSNNILSPGASTGARTLTVAVAGSSDNLTIAVPVQNYDASNTYALNKSGSGTLTLTGANTYTGNTTVNDGKVLVTGAGTLGTGDVSVNGSSRLVLDTSAAIGDTKNLTVASAAKVEVVSAQNETVNELVIAGARKWPGVWGRVGGSAPNQDSHIEGDGFITVQTGAAHPAMLIKFK